MALSEKEKARIMAAIHKTRPLKRDEPTPEEQKARRQEPEWFGVVKTKERTPEEKLRAEEKEKERLKEESKAASKWFFNLPVENERRLKEHEKTHETAALRKKEQMKFIGQSKKFREGTFKAICDVRAKNPKVATNRKVWETMSSTNFQEMVVVDSIQYEVRGEGQSIVQTRQSDFLPLGIKQRTFEKYMTLARKPYKPRRFF